MKAWIARDANGEVYMFRRKPRYGKITGTWLTKTLDDVLFLMRENEIPKGINPKCTDEEPIKVEVTITKV